MTAAPTNPITVAITGVAATENPGPGIGVARSLRLWAGPQIRLVALAYDAAECLALAGELFDHVFLMPYPGQGVESTLDRLKEIHAEVPMNFLIPCLDVEIPLLLAAKAQLTEMGIDSCLPSKTAYARRNKNQLSALSEKLGISVPETIVITHPGEIIPATKKLGFPLFVKGNQYGAKKVFTLTELQNEVEASTRQWGYPILLQQAVLGTDMLLAGLGNGRGGLSCGAVALRKEHQTSQGKLWNALTVQCPWLQDAAEAFVAETEWEGPFEFECLLGDDGSAWLIEINPRFPAWIHAGTLLGVNLPACLVGRLNQQEERVPDLIPAGKWVVRSICETVLDQDPMNQLISEGKYCHAENI